MSPRLEQRVRLRVDIRRRRRGRQSDNSIKVLPNDIGRLTSLVLLDLSSNSLRRLPPSLAQLKRRLEGRPGADEKSVQSRLDGAGQDILRWGEYDYAIVNDNLDTAFEELKSILITERNKRVRASLGIMVDTLLKDARLATKTQSGSATGEAG